MQNPGDDVERLYALIFKVVAKIRHYGGVTRLIGSRFHGPLKQAFPQKVAITLMAGELAFGFMKFHGELPGRCLTKQILSGLVNPIFQ